MSTPRFRRGRPQLGRIAGVSGVERNAMTLHNLHRARTAAGLSVLSVALRQFMLSGFSTPASSVDHCRLITRVTSFHGPARFGDLLQRQDPPVRRSRPTAARFSVPLGGTNRRSIRSSSNSRTTWATSAKGRRWACVAPARRRSPRRRSPFDLRPNTPISRQAAVCRSPAAEPNDFDLPPIAGGGTTDGWKRCGSGGRWPRSGTFILAGRSCRGLI
jgi:hypothetical protein